MMTLHEFAKLVQQLRTVQKADGSGYKTPTSKAEAKPLEQQVDAAVSEILKPRPFTS